MLTKLSLASVQYSVSTTSDTGEDHWGRHVPPRPTRLSQAATPPPHMTKLGPHFAVSPKTSLVGVSATTSFVRRRSRSSTQQSGRVRADERDTGNITTHRDTTEEPGDNSEEVFERADSV